MGSGRKVMGVLAGGLGAGFGEFNKVKKEEKKVHEAKKWWHEKNEIERSQNVEAIKLRNKNAVDLQLNSIRANKEAATVADTRATERPTKQIDMTAGKLADSDRKELEDRNSKIKDPDMRLKKEQIDVIHALNKNDYVKQITQKKAGIAPKPVDKLKLLELRIDAVKTLFPLGLDDEQKAALPEGVSEFQFMMETVDAEVMKQMGSTPSQNDQRAASALAGNITEVTDKRAVAVQQEKSKVLNNLNSMPDSKALSEILKIEQDPNAPPVVKEAAAEIKAKLIKKTGSSLKSATGVPGQTKSVLEQSFDSLS